MFRFKWWNVLIDECWNLKIAFNVLIDECEDLIDEKYSWNMFKNRTKQRILLRYIILAVIHIHTNIEKSCRG